MGSSRVVSAVVAFLVLPVFGSAQQATPADWLTWGYDQERTGWNRAETTLSKDNVSRLELKWSAQLDTVPKDEVLSTLTAPLVAAGVSTAQGPKDVVFVVGSDDVIYALDAESGNVFWRRKFANSIEPIRPPTYLCPNTQNATPVIDQQSGTVYLTTSDGKLRGLSLVDGEDRLPPTDFVTPHGRNWSLNLIDGVIYTPVARGCGGAIANFAAMDISNPARPKVHFYTSIGRPAGAWGRGGMVRGPKGVYAHTADGPYDPAGGRFGNSVMALSFKDLRLLDSFTPSNWQFLNSKDLDLGSAGPVIFPFQDRTLVAAAAKEAVIYLLDADALGGGPLDPKDRFSGADHHTPLHQSRWGNDENQLWGRGVWGAMATWEDPEGQRWLIVPMWGPPAKDAPKFKYSYAPAEKGSVMAFQVGVENEKPALIPVWMSRDMHVPDPPAVANGVVFSVATGENTRQGGYFPPDVRRKPVGHAILYAFDAATGKELYSSGNLIESFAHFGGLAISKGRIYFSTWDGKVHAFGLKQ
jgi:hypothetical protein